MVVGCTTTCAISVYHHWCCELEPRSYRGALDTTLCDKVRQWLAAGRWFSVGTPVSSTDKTDRHDIAEILLKVALNIINLTHLCLDLAVCVKCCFNYCNRGNKDYFNIRHENEQKDIKSFIIHRCFWRHFGTPPWSL